MKIMMILAFLLLSSIPAWAGLYIDSNGNIVDTGDSGVQTQILR